MSDSDNGEVDSPWTDDVGIRQYTDTDIEETRTKYTRASDPNGELRQLVDTYREHSDLDDDSEILDRALRVEVAAVVDDHRVSFNRDEYDVAYTIPPAGWLSQRVFSEVDILDEDEVGDEDRAIGYSTTPTAFEMAQEAVDEGIYSSLSEMVKAGLQRLLGQ